MFKEFPSQTAPPTRGCAGRLFAGGPEAESDVTWGSEFGRSECGYIAFSSGFDLVVVALLASFDSVADSVCSAVA